MSKTISRRNFLKLAAATGTGAVLAACGTQPTATPVAPISSQFTGTLRVLGLPGAPVQPANDLLTAGFTSRYPGMQVKYEYIQGTYDEQLYTAAAAGTLADVFFCADLYVVPFAAHGVTLDLKPAAESDPTVKLDDVFPNMLGLSTFNNKIIMFPSGLDVVVMYYNRTLLKQAGVGDPPDTWTWDDYAANMQKVTALAKDAQGNPQYWGMSNGAWSWWATVYPWIVGYGGDIVDSTNKKSTWSDPKTLGGLKAYANLWTTAKVAQPMGLDVGGDAFTLGRAATTFTIQAARPGYRDAIKDKFDFDVQLVPKMPNGKHETGMGTWGMSVYSKSKQIDAAFQYLKGLISPNIQRILAKQMVVVPLNKSVTSDPTWMDGIPTPPKNLMAFVKAADDAILPYMNYPGACGSFYSGIVSKAYSDALEAVLRGKSTPEEAFPGADKTIQDCLDQQK